MTEECIMKTKHLWIAVSLILVCALVLQLTGCGTQVPETPGKITMRAANLMEGITPVRMSSIDPKAENCRAAADFGVRLFRAERKEGKNTLLSPLSVLSALAMTANGAKGETLAQIEAVLGMSQEALNEYCGSMLLALSQEDGKLQLANSIWFTADERFTVNRDFLQKNADVYGADVYKAPFDNSTLQDINDWVKDKTKGMIPEILDKINPGAVMYLVNALAFDAKWANPYTTDQIHEGVFTLENGREKTVDFMYGEEQLYLEDEKATGFLKVYEGGKYGLAALLPKEGVSLTDYVASLDGTALQQLLAQPQECTVLTALPKFEAAYDTELSDLLKGMGMPEPFDGERADFTGLGTSEEGNISISRVLHKTFISVDEAGTKAGAATVVEMTDGALAVEDLKQVYLTRPFVYLLVDLETGVPFFIGTLEN